MKILDKEIDNIWFYFIYFLILIPCVVSKKKKNFTYIASYEKK